MAALVVQFLQALFEFLMHVIRVLGLNLDDDRQPRLAAHESCQAPGARRAEHGVAFEVPQPPPLFDDLRAMANARGLRRRIGVFRAPPAFAATPQHRLPVVAVLVVLDPGVDRLRRHAAVAILLLHAARDLFRRPFLRQSSADRVVDLGVFHLSHERTFPASPLSFALRLGGVVFASRAIASQLATDRGWAAPQRLGDFILIHLLMPQLRYAIPFFQRKMTCHRWDSVPKEKLATLLPLEHPSDAFSETSLRGSFPEPRLHLKLGTARAHSGPGGCAGSAIS